MASKYAFSLPIAAEVPKNKCAGIQEGVNLFRDTPANSGRRKMLDAED
jgi:hypothetical protein